MATSVVLAEKHLDLMEGIRGILEAEFDTVMMVSDRSSLLIAVESVPLDLVVVDLSLPIPDGINIAKYLKDVNPDLKIIVLSLSDEMEIATMLIDAGAGGFVLKRTVGKDLPAAVQSVMQGRTFISPSVHHV